MAVSKKNWRTLVKEFLVTEQKARAICKNPHIRTNDNLARFKLFKDLGHNRIEVTYRYVPREKSVLFLKNQVDPDNKTLKLTRPSFQNVE